MSVCTAGVVSVPLWETESKTRTQTRLCRLRNSNCLGYIRSAARSSPFCSLSVTFSSAVAAAGSRFNWRRLRKTENAGLNNRQKQYSNAQRDFKSLSSTCAVILLDKWDYSPATYRDIRKCAWASLTGQNGRMQREMNYRELKGGWTSPFAYVRCRGIIKDLFSM